MNLDKPEMIAPRDGYGKALLELGEKNPNIVVLTAGVSESVRANWFDEKFPERFFNIGIAEQNMLMIAAGLSLSGKIPFALTFGSFMARAVEHARVTISYGQLNVKVFTTHSGLNVGADGASAQMMEDISMFRVLPHFTVMAPADFWEAKKATIAAANTDGAFYVRVGREKAPVVTEENSPFEIGKGIVMRDGKDVSLIACGPMVFEALKAAEELQKQGISARVLNFHTIKPLDLDLLRKAAKETGAIVTAEEHQVIGGLGGAIAEGLAKTYPVPQEFVGMQDKFGSSGGAKELLDAYGLNAQSIADAAMRAIARKR